LVSVALAQERPVRRSERLAERIQQILNERGRVEQVKGIVAAHMAGSPTDAYAVLEFHARTHGITVVAAANDVIEGKAAAVTIVSAWRRRDMTDGAP
jgi:AmiR/NasT family two-component response regulator